MRPSTAPTLRDIAREAGVTAMTVSVVLNGASSSTRVSETTRTRIREVAARLRYQPNAVARGLSRRRMDTIGVACQIEGGELNLYFLEVLNGILEANAAQGQNTSVLSIRDWHQDEPRLLAFCDGRVDGVICIGPMFSSAFAETLQHHTPFITLHSNQALPNTYNLDVDNEAGAYAMTQYLVGLGHRRILHLSAALHHNGAKDRLSGYRRALAEAGLPYVEALVVPGDYSVDSGRERMAVILDTRSLNPLPTAIFCANDAVAYGCLEVLNNRGLRVPLDISVAGFDDSLTARMTTPPLTTVRQPFREMGRRAVELLLTRIQTKDAQIIGTLESDADLDPAAVAAFNVFPLKLVIRGSVAPPPASPLPSSFRYS